MSTAHKSHLDAEVCTTSLRSRARRQLDFSNLHPDQNLSEFEVCFFLCFSRSTLRNKLNERSPYHDLSFPKSHPLRGQAAKGGAVRWRAGEIIEWNRNLATSQLGAASR